MPTISPRASEQLRSIIEDKGFRHSAVAKAMGLDASKFSKVLSGAREPDFNEVGKLAHFLQMPIREALALFGLEYSNWMENRQLIVGYVGAGDEVFIEFADGGGFDEIRTPFIGYEGTVVRVRGDSMSPRYLSGEHVAYSEPGDVTSLVGDEVVAKTADGRLLLKRLLRGTEKNKFTLVSINPIVEPIQNVELEWAAPIDWHLPSRRAR